MSAGILSANCETSYSLLVSRHVCTTLSGVVHFFHPGRPALRRGVLEETVGRPSLARLAPFVLQGGVRYLTKRSKSRLRQSGEWRVKRSEGGETAAAVLSLVKVEGRKRDRPTPSAAGVAVWLRLLAQTAKPDRRGGRKGTANRRTRRGEAAAEAGRMLLTRRGGDARRRRTGREPESGAVATRGEASVACEGGGGQSFQACT
jgi:hypothetical protein